MQNKASVFFYTNMSKTRKFIVIRMMCFFLIGVVFSTSIFTSSFNSLYVYAEESYQPDDADLASAIMNIIATVLKFIFPDKSPLIEAINRLGQNGIVVADYYTYNGDGTYTIDEQLFQEVLNAIQDVEKSTFSDGDVINILNGESYTYEVYLYSSYVASNNMTYTSTGIGNIILHFPVVAVYTARGSSPGDSINFYYIDNNDSFSSYKMAITVDFNGNVSNQKLFVFWMNSHYETCSYDYALNFPIFDTEEAAETYLRTGTGYENALNYTDSESFEYSSNYTGSYSGGDMIVSSAVLDGISAKVDELNQTGKSTDEKIDELYDYIIGDGETDDDSKEDEDDKEKPDTILGWLEKINDNLEAILKQVKQIKWLSVADLVDDVLFNLIEIKSSFEPVVQTMSRKFPFSIPWDTALVFGLLADVPEAPYYELPFVIESVGINEVIVVDLAGYEPLSKLSRGLLTLTFLMMLFAFSRKLAQWFANK